MCDELEKEDEVGEGEVRSWEQCLHYRARWQIAELKQGVCLN